MLHTTDGYYGFSQRCQILIKWVQNPTNNQKGFGSFPLKCTEYHPNMDFQIYSTLLASLWENILGSIDYMGGLR